MKFRKLFSVLLFASSFMFCAGFADKTAAVMLEFIQGEGGVNVVDNEYIAPLFVKPKGSKASSLQTYFEKRSLSILFFGDYAKYQNSSKNLS